MSAIRTKICGITSVDDALIAVAAGADAIGLVFFTASPRAVTIEQARHIAMSVGPFVTVTGLFVDAEDTFIRQVLSAVRLHLLQFHGDEPEDFCDQFQRPYVKAIRMRPELNVEQAIAQYPGATGILLDAYRAGVPGGTGETFDWQRVPKHPTKPIVLAGGLTPENVAQAINATSVYGVDVSGGVESAPGKKDAYKVKTFIHNARHMTKAGM